jgi:hypothetical protein
MVYVLNTKCILRRESRCSSHRIAPMCSDDLLVSFKTTEITLSVAIGDVHGEWENRTLRPSCPSRQLPGSASQQPLGINIGL